MTLNAHATVALSAIALSCLLAAGCTAAAEPHPLNSTDSADVEPTPTDDSPAYTTELQLSEDEKAAVEEALDVLGRYIDVMNEVYSQSGVGADGFEAVAKDAALEMAQNDSREMVSSGDRMVGKMRTTSNAVTEVNLDESDETPIPFVTVIGCVPADEFNFEDSSGNDLTEAELEVVEFEFVVAEYDDAWFVSEQSAVGESCGHTE